MHQIKLFTFTTGMQEFFYRIKVRLGLKGSQRVQPKHGIVKITLAPTIFDATIGVLLVCQEILNQLGSVTQYLRC